MAGSDVTGGMGAAIPDGAPREVSQPVVGATAEQVARARANERSLAPLQPPPTTPPAAAEPHPEPNPKLAVGRPGGKGKRPVPTPALAPVTEVAPTPPGETGVELAGPAATEAVTEALASLPLPPDLNDDPVTAEPAHGKPQKIADPGKQITGGFAPPQGEAFYQALDGQELGQLVGAMCVEIASQVLNDLRFSIAVTYPRVRASVVLTIEGFGKEAPDVVLPKVRSFEETPLEIADQLADEMCFIIKVRRDEVDADGEPQTPPNALRQEIGATIPRKQRRKDANGLEHWTDV